MKDLSKKTKFWGIINRNSTVDQMENNVCRKITSKTKKESLKKFKKCFSTIFLTFEVFETQIGAKSLPKSNLIQKKTQGSN